MKKKKYPKFWIPENAKVLSMTIQRKCNGWIVIVEFDGSVFYTREFVFNTKTRMVKWLNEIEWYPKSK